MKKAANAKLKTKHVLWILMGVCAIAMVVTILNPGVGLTVRNGVSYVLTPIQKGINSMGSWLTDKADKLKSLDEYMKENEKLQAELNELKEENSILVQNKEELNRLREMYKLDQNYDSYNKVAAHIIAKDSGNWFHSFTINKGSNAGLTKDMNVIGYAGGGSGLIGIIEEVGPDYAKVKSIIEDGYNVSGKSSSSSEPCIVVGDLETIQSKGLLTIKNIKKTSGIKEGDSIVTSHISKKYQQGLLIGYVTYLTDDPNDLTRSGTLRPVVDFERLEDVLVITQLKQTEPKTDE